MDKLELTGGIYININKKLIVLCIFVIFIFFMGASFASSENLQIYEDSNELSVDDSSDEYLIEDGNTDSDDDNSSDQNIIASSKENVLSSSGSEADEVTKNNITADEDNLLGLGDDSNGFLTEGDEKISPTLTLTVNGGSDNSQKYLDEYIQVNVQASSDYEDGYLTLYFVDDDYNFMVFYVPVNEDYLLKLDYAGSYSVYAYIPESDKYTETYSNRVNLKINDLPKINVTFPETAYVSEDLTIYVYAVNDTDIVSWSGVVFVKIDDELHEVNIYNGQGSFDLNALYYGQKEISVCHSGFGLNNNNVYNNYVICGYMNVEYPQLNIYFNENTYDEVINVLTDYTGNKCTFETVDSEGNHINWNGYIKVELYRNIDYSYNLEDAFYVDISSGYGELDLGNLAYGMYYVKGIFWYENSNYGENQSYNILNVSYPKLTIAVNGNNYDEIINVLAEDNSLEFTFETVDSDGNRVYWNGEVKAELYWCYNEDYYYDYSNYYSIDTYYTFISSGYGSLSLSDLPYGIYYLKVNLDYQYGDNAVYNSSFINASFPELIISYNYEEVDSELNLTTQNSYLYLTSVDSQGSSEPWSGTIYFEISGNYYYGIFKYGSCDMALYDLSEGEYDANIYFISGDGEEYFYKTLRLNVGKISPEILISIDGYYDSVEYDAGSEINVYVEVSNDYQGDYPDYVTLYLYSDNGYSESKYVRLYDYCRITVDYAGNYTVLAQIDGDDKYAYTHSNYLNLTLNKITPSIDLYLYSQYEVYFVYDFDMGGSVYSDIYDDSFWQDKYMYIYFVSDDYETYEYIPVNSYKEYENILPEGTYTVYAYYEGDDIHNEAYSEIHEINFTKLSPNQGQVQVEGGVREGRNNLNITITVLAEEQAFISIDYFTDHHKKYEGPANVQIGGNEKTGIYFTDGVTAFITPKLQAGKYDINITIEESDYVKETTITIPLNIVKSKPTLELYFEDNKNKVSDSVYVGNDVNFTLRVLTTYLNQNSVSGYFIYYNSTRANYYNGTVQVNVANSSYYIYVTNGVGNFTLNNLACGNYTVNISMGDNKYFDAVSKNRILTVKPLPVDIKVAVNNLNYDLDEYEGFDNYADIYVNVGCDDNHDGTYDYGEFNGSVLINVDGSIYRVAVENGVGQYTVSGLVKTLYTINATFEGNSRYEASNSKNKTLKLGTSSIDVNVKVNGETERADAYVGDAVAISIEMDDDFTGNVLVNIGNESYYVAVISGRGNLTLTNLTNNVYTVNASFMGNLKYMASNSSNVILNISKRSTEVKITLENKTIDEGDVTYVNVVMTPEIDSYVTVSVNGENYTVALINGIGKLTLAGLMKGNYTVNATFSENDRYLSSISNSQNLTVNEKIVPASATVMTVEVADVTYPENSTAVISLSGMANGTVTISIDGKVYQTADVENGTAQISLGRLSAGVKNLTANFTSTDGVNTNATVITKILVKQAASEISIDISGYDVKITLTEGASGNLTVYINNIKNEIIYSGEEIVLSNVLKIGNNTVVAIYDGNENFTSSKASNETAIPKKSSSVIVTADNITYGSDAVITVEVGENQTGYVTVTLNGRNYTSQITSGAAVFNIGGLNVSDYTVTALYSGDDNFTGADNETTFSVTKADLPAGVVALNVTVNDNASFAINGVPSDFNGKVNITVDGITYSGDVKSLIQMSKFSEGEKSAHIVFYGDDNYNNLELDCEFKITNTSSDEGNISTINSDNMTRAYNSEYDYQAVFLDKKGNALKNTEVKFIVNGKEYTVKTNEDGIAQLTGSKLAAGTYNITSINLITSEEAVNELKIVERITENSDLVMDFHDGSVFKVKVFGDDGNIAPEGEVIDITVNGVHYAGRVDSKGYAQIPIQLLPKTYTVTAEYKGFKTTNKLTVKQVLKPVKKTVKVKKSKKSFKIKASLKWSNGKGIKGKKITFKIKGKTYKAKTNKKGIATAKVKKNIIKKLKKGKKYKVTIAYTVKDKYGNGYIKISDKVKCKVKVKK